MTMLYHFRDITAMWEFGMCYCTDFGTSRHYEHWEARIYDRIQHWAANWCCSYVVMSYCCFWYSSFILFAAVAIIASFGCLLTVLLINKLTIHVLGEAWVIFILFFIFESVLHTVLGERFWRAKPSPCYVLLEQRLILRREQHRNARSWLPAYSHGEDDQV